MGIVFLKERGRWNIMCFRKKIDLYSGVTIAIVMILFMTIGCVSSVPKYSVPKSEDKEVGKKGKERFDFTDLHVKDNSSGLIWTIDGNLAGKGVKWEEANEFIARINADKYAGFNDWRLPSKEELESLATSGKIIQNIYKEEKLSSAFNHAGFRNVQTNYYWSSTTDEGNTYNAWIIAMYNGRMSRDAKEYFNCYVWPVRSGH